VERKFNKKIITMQTDRGGEYEKLNLFFSKTWHYTSCIMSACSSTKWLRRAQIKHRHIVEIGLALLAHASMPLKFWDEAFLTPTYLINLAKQGH
jgi:histone deacetylase 1/2